MVSGSVGNDSFEVVGQKAIISQIVQDELRGIINKVEGTRKVVEEKNAKEAEEKA